MGVGVLPKGERDTFNQSEIIIGRDVTQIGDLWAEQFEYVEVETPQLAAAVQAWHDVIAQAEDAAG